MTWAVQFDAISKRYPGGGARYSSLRHDLSAAFRRLLGGGRRHGPASAGTLALDDVSFTVREGESFAVIGPNGAGKTTALKIISRISYPTAGEVRVRGRVGALIEVGSGVHPELTARENIRLYVIALGSLPDPRLLGVSLAMTIVVALVGYRIFKSLEPGIADTI